MGLKKQKVLYTHSKKPTIIPRLLVVGNFLLLTCLLLLLPPQNAYSMRAMTEEHIPKVDLIPPTPAPYPINSGSFSPPPLTAQGIMIVDIASGVSLYEKNPDERLFPASTTKIMTALITLEDYKLTDVVTVSTVITEKQVMGLVGGEMLTVENLLYGILVHSANDAAFTLAEHHEGGVATFIARMNEKARALHLDSTHFVNPIGFDDQQHYTTARDLAKLSLYALKDPTIRKMSGVAQITVSDTEFSHFHALKNVNELLGKVPGVSGLKTGWTELAGQSLVTTIHRNGHEVLIVLLKSVDRFNETEQLLNWVFANFTWKEFAPPG